MMLRAGIAGLGIWCSLLTAGWARDIYVNNVEGDDRQDGSAAVATGALVGPVRTIAAALRRADRGDRIVIANTGEPYRESITLQGGRHSGSRRVAFELVGNGATLDGTRTIAAGRWNHFRDNVYRYRPAKMQHQMLYLDDKPAARVSITDVQQVDQLQPRQWSLLGGYLYFRAEPGRGPSHYNLSHTALPVGITLYEVRHVLVRDLIVQGFQLDGVNAHDGVGETTLASLNCRGNGRSGISIGGASRVRIEACLVGNNGVAQVRTEGYSHTHLVACDLLDNTAPRIVRDGGRVRETE